MIILMKTGPYNPFRSKLNKYHSYGLITLQQYDPPLDVKAMEACLTNIKIDLAGVDYLLTSNLKRASQTAQYLKNAGIIRPNIPVGNKFFCSLLNEVKFDLRAFCSQAEYEAQGSVIVRQRFITGFINDNLAETRRYLKQRFARLAKEIFQLQQRHQNILCVSHTFFIKLYGIYQERPDLFEHPQIIKNYIDPAKRIMDFCETIVF